MKMVNILLKEQKKYKILDSFMGKKLEKFEWLWLL